MIYGLARDLDGLIRGKGFPIRVVYGPERVTRTGADQVIIVSRDTSKSDQIAPVVGAQSNPAMRGVIGCASKAVVLARSPVKGAMMHDHEDACETYVRAFIVALFFWGVAGGAGQIPIVEARFLTEAERQQPDVNWTAGAAYILRFAVAQAIMDLTAAGAGLPEATLGVPANGFNGETPGTPARAFSNRIEVSESGGDDAEVVELP